MPDLQDAILAAWERVRPRLLADPAELAMLRHPPRAWCLAIWAGDRRIEPGHVPICPESAMDPNDREHPGRRIGHEVDLDAKQLRRLCRQVNTAWPCEKPRDVARRLGVSALGLRAARISGAVHTHYVRGLGGHGASPRPLIYSKRPLDPCARDGFHPPDPLWAWTAEHLTARLPDDFQQTLIRVPTYRGEGRVDIYVPLGNSVAAAVSAASSDVRIEKPPRTAASTDMHPELRHEPPKMRTRPLLPPPPPDYVWYKWKDDAYIGDSHDRKLEKRREARARAKREGRLKTPPSRSTGSLHFHGWRWLCPVCARRVRVLYLPLPMLMFGSVPYGPNPALFGVKIDRPAPRLACMQCHGVHAVTRLNYRGWNCLISHLTGGLLFGREVPRPADFHFHRTRAFGPRPTRPPSERRQQVLDLLLKGWTRRRIARLQRVSVARIHAHVDHIYRQYNVHSLTELASTLGIKLPFKPRTGHPDLRLRAQILEHLLAGRPRRQIIALTGKTLPCVAGHISHLYRQHGVRRRKELMTKMGARMQVGGTAPACSENVQPA